MSQFLQYLAQRRLHSQGFSLVEMLVVLVIIGLFMTIGARKFVDSSSDVKSSIRRFTTTVKKLRNRARLDNKTYRLVFDLPIERNKQQSYWVESTSKEALLLNEEQRKELTQAMETEMRKKMKSSKKKTKPDPQGFSPDRKVIRKPPATLPRGLYFRSIEIDSDKVEEVTSGRVYIYFFPQGYVQTSAIHLTDRNKKNWSLAIKGLTGQVDIFNTFTSLEDIKRE